MAKYGFRTPVHIKPDPATIIINTAFNIFVGIGTAAIGIDMFNKRKAAKAAKKGGHR